MMKLYNIDMAAAELGVNKLRIYRAVARGKIQCYQVGASAILDDQHLAQARSYFQADTTHKKGTK